MTQGTPPRSKAEWGKFVAAKFMDFLGGLFFGAGLFGAYFLALWIVR